MTPGARIAAAIELLEQPEQERARQRVPFDAHANAYFRARRFIGAKDRAAVAETAYGVLRRRAQLDWWNERAGAPEPRLGMRARVFAYLALAEGWAADRIAGACDGGRHRPAPPTREERAALARLEGRTLDHPDQPASARFNFPAWLEPLLRAQFGDLLEAEMAALLVPATLDLRVNALKGTRDEALRHLVGLGLKAATTTLSPWGIRLAERTALGALDAYQSGLLEVQDEGSQVAALLVGARPGMRVCDFCAGAGGKTLALAAAMDNKGHVVACDVSAVRLEGATKRLRRAGAFNVERRVLAGERDTWVKRHAGSFDRVLVDAPCTGTGTWRRNPDARWTTTAADLAELVALQRRILDSAWRLVKPGGRLVYVTCSLLAEENEQQAERFAAEHPEFVPVPADEAWREAVGGVPPGDGPYLRLTPARHGTDGFFAAVFARRSGAQPESC